ncbi:hypothetical protein MUP77_13820, partial [Candidatus Bathyarchaeota archaeon]|nr:hypothetical protein [Candidatus Bathyarchaeota archaeon]
MSEFILWMEYFLSQTIIFLPLIFPLAKRHLRSDPTKETVASFNGHLTRGSSLKRWSLVLLPSLLLSIFPKLFLSPGGDDVAYIKAITEIRDGGASFLIWGDNTVLMRPLLYVYLALLSFLSNDNYSVVFTLSKIISSVILVYGIYRLLSHFQISENTRLWASSISSIIPSILLLNTDLYANYFGYAISFVFFSYLLDYLNNRDRKSLLISSLSLASIAFIHVETYFIAVSTTLVFALISLIFPSSKRTAVLYPSLKIILPSIAALFPFALLSITTYHYFGVFSNYLGPANQRYGLTFFSGILGAQSAAADPYWGNIPMMLLLMQGRGVVVPFVNFLALILVLLGTTLTGLEANGRKLLFSMNFTMIICILNLYGVMDILSARLSLFYPAPILIGLSLDWLTARAGSSLDWMSRETVSSYRKAVTIGEYSVDWLGAKIRLGLDWVSAKVASGGGRIERAQIGVLGRSIDFRAVAYSMDWIETRIGLVLNRLNERIVS